MVDKLTIELVSPLCVCAYVCVDMYVKVVKVYTCISVPVGHNLCTEDMGETM